MILDTTQSIAFERSKLQKGQLLCKCFSNRDLDRSALVGKLDQDLCYPLSDSRNKTCL